MEVYYLAPSPFYVVWLVKVCARRGVLGHLLSPTRGLMMGSRGACFCKVAYLATSKALVWEVGILEISQSLDNNGSSIFIREADEEELVSIAKYRIIG